MRKLCKKNNIILIEIDGRTINIQNQNIESFLEKAIGDIKCVGSYLLGEPDNDWVF